MALKRRGIHFLFHEDECLSSPVHDTDVDVRQKISGIFFLLFVSFLALILISVHGYLFGVAEYAALSILCLGEVFVCIHKTQRSTQESQENNGIVFDTKKKISQRHEVQAGNDKEGVWRVEGNGGGCS